MNKNYKCEKCWFWTARSNEHYGGIMLICSNEKSPKFNLRTGAADGCDYCKLKACSVSDWLGIVDQPVIKSDICLLIILALIIISGCNTVIIEPPPQPIELERPIYYLTIANDVNRPYSERLKAWQMMRKSRSVYGEFRD
jgi:hypothetical protein